MLEVRETSPAKDLKHGHTIVGTIAVPVSLYSMPLVRGLMLRAPGPNDLNPNTDVIYVGLKSVTADASATGGMPLLPGSAIELPVDDPSLIYVISNSPSQDLAWLGV